METSAPCQKAARGSPRLALADVLRASFNAHSHQLCAHHRKILNTIVACRTPRLGAHRYHCSHCHRDHFAPRSCGNRHCPNCQGRQAVDWLEKQSAMLLPIPYFHVVFTLPHSLNPLIQQNQRALYNLLFKAASATLMEFGRNNLGAELGLTLVLHTWGQTLIDHYHVHCIVTGGGLANGGTEWKSAGDKFLFPVVALGKVFRGKFRDGLQDLYAEGKLEFHGQLQPLKKHSRFQALVREATAKSWNVYAKKPFAGPKQVLAYLSRYTHRVAIGNRRLLHLDRDNGHVTFSYKIREKGATDQRRSMTLDLNEFLRRFCLHLLPERFVKIRHYGMLSNRGRSERVDHARKLLSEVSGPAADAQADGKLWSPPPIKCPFCGQPALELVETIRGPVDPERLNSWKPP